MKPFLSRLLSGIVLTLALSACHPFFHHHHRHYGEHGGDDRHGPYREVHDPRSDRQIQMDRNRDRAERYRDH